MLSNESSIDTAALGLIKQRESARSSAVITEKSGLHEKKIGTNKGRIINDLLFILYDFWGKGTNKRPYFSPIWYQSSQNGTGWH